MGFERATLFGIIDLELESTAGGTLTLQTDLPGNALVVRETKTVPVTTTRRVVRFRLQGTTKGRLYSVKLVPTGSGVIRLYGGRIWARVLPGATWEWYAIPIPETSAEWTPVKLPIPGVSEWAASPLPIPKMGDWQPSKLEIPPTGDWMPSKLPVPPTSEWEPARLPIKPTPPMPEWVNLEVDQ